MIRYEESREKPRRYEAIRCLDCRVFLTSKNEAARKHKGHAVHYTDKEGNIDE